MKKIALTLGFSGLVFLCHAQVENPVTWKFIITKTADKTYELICIATISDSWHIYSQDVLQGDIVFPTSISFAKNPLIVLQGKPKEVGELIRKHEKSLGVDLKYYEGQVKFVQLLTVKNNAKTKLNGVIEFMACTSSGCLPPATRSFTIILNK